MEKSLIKIASFVDEDYVLKNETMYDLLNYIQEMIKNIGNNVQQFKSFINNKFDSDIANPAISAGEKALTRYLNRTEKLNLRLSVLALRNYLPKDCPSKDIIFLAAALEIIIIKRLVDKIKSKENIECQEYNIEGIKT